MYKKVLFGADARNKIIKGVNIVADAVTTTLGPKGQNVIFEESIFPTITKDGVTVAQQILLEDKFENMGVMIAREAAENTNREAGDGPQPLYSKVLTPEGFTTMGEIRVGDTICGTNGTIQKVIGVFPKGEKEIVEVEFGDGRIVECCEDHLWTVTTNTGKTKTMTVREILKTNICQKNKNGQNNYKYYTPISVPEFYEGHLPIDPYTLGVLIGDGSLSGLCSTEISLGIKKEHVLDKLKFPTGITTNISFIPEKKYFRVKIVGKTLDGRTIRDILREVGLQGTRSENKHIPKRYLYSSISSRTALLQGLTDTDGYTNNRGLLEYSTISDRLYLDVLELLRGLGRTTHNYLMKRKDGKSYSMTSIYRISELAGYKHGNKIVDIRTTGRYTEMQCIKVSNEDNLYYTNNYILTHNTTSTIAILRDIINEGNKYIVAGMNPVLIKRGMNNVLEEVLSLLDEQKKDVTTDSEKQQIARISANNDSELGDLIAKVIEETGTNGVVTVTNSSLLKTEVEYVKGTKLNRGYSSHYFINDRKRLTANLENPTIILTTDKISLESQLVEILQRVIMAGKKQMILVADAIEGQALAFLAQNHLLGKFTCIPVSMPSFGDYQKDLFYDLATLTGATVLGEEESVRLADGDIEHTGTCGMVSAYISYTIFTDTPGDPKERIDEVTALMEGEKDLFKKEQLKNRLGRLTGSIANIKVGGASETDQTEIKYRIEDALNATKSAVEDGIVEGAGLALLRCANKINKKAETREEEAGRDIVIKALSAPSKKILQNAGLPVDAIVQKIIDNNIGYNTLTEQYEDLFTTGVIDPLRCVKNEIINAVATSGVLMTSNVAIAVKEKNGDSNNSNR